MSDKYTTNFRSFLPDRSRGLVLGLTAGVVISVSFTTWAAHDPIDPGVSSDFTTGDTILAEEFDVRFGYIYTWGVEVDDHIADLEAQIAAVQIYMDASPCGETAALNGSIGGYAGSKTQCQDECNSPTAHTCSSSEVVRFQEDGGDLQVTGWVTSATYSYNGVSNVYRDCQGWTSAIGFEAGVYWDKDVAAFQAVGCNNMMPLICCD